MFYVTQWNPITKFFYTYFVLTVLENPSFESIQLINVTGMDASAAYYGHPVTTIDKAFEGTDSFLTNDCYISNTYYGGDWATIDIERAAVSQIKLLNRGDCCREY